MSSGLLRLTWKQRSFKRKDILYIWVGENYAKTGLKNGKAALLVVIGAISDRTKRCVSRALRQIVVSDLV